MKLKSSVLAVLLFLFLPYGAALAGVNADFDAQITKNEGGKAIFVDSTSQYIHFCGSFLGNLYYGETLVKTDPDLLTLKKNLPLYSSIHFNGGITGKEGATDHFCLSDASESEITILTQEYVVEEGDTLRKILRKLGGHPFDYKLIARFNGLASPSSITTGQTLILPIY